MIPLGRIQGLNGRIVLVVFVGLLTGWALALLRQSQQYVPDHVPVPDNQDLIMRRRQIMEYTPQSLLEQFYRQLNVTTRRLDPTGREPVRQDELVVLLHPGAQAPVKLVDQLVAHVEQGGRLVVFTDTELDMMKRFGLSTPAAATATDDPVAPRAATVEGSFVKQTRAPYARAVMGAKRPMVPLLRSGSNVVAGMAGIGAGSVTVVMGRMADYAWIEQEDNAIFLANLVLEKPSPIAQFDDATQMGKLSKSAPGTAGTAPVALLDYDAEVLRRLYALEAEENKRMEEARRRWHYDSLWSLIKANPVSAALLQLVLGLMVFGMARARRLGEALPDRLGRTELPGTLDARANLFERSGAFRLAISRAVRHTNRWLAVRLGLLGDPTAAEFKQALDAISPKAAARYASLVQFVAHVSDGHTAADDRSLSGIWNLIDLLRKELPTP